MCTAHHHERKPVTHLRHDIPSPTPASAATVTKHRSRRNTGINDGTVCWGVKTILRTRSWTVQAVMSRILYSSLSHVSLQVARAYYPAQSVLHVAHTRERSNSTDRLHQQGGPSGPSYYCLPTVSQCVKTTINHHRVRCFQVLYDVGGRKFPHTM